MKRKKLIVIVLVLVLVLCFVGCGFALGVLKFDDGKKVEVHNDITEYNSYIHNASEEKYIRCSGEMYEIFSAATSDNPYRKSKMGK